MVLTQKFLRNVRSNLQGSAKCEPPRACTMTRNTIAAKRESQAFLGKFKKTFKRSEVSCAEQTNDAEQPCAYLCALHNPSISHLTTYIVAGVQAAKSLDQDSKDSQFCFMFFCYLDLTTL